MNNEAALLTLIAQYYGENLAMRQRIAELERQLKAATAPKAENADD